LSSAVANTTLYELKKPRYGGPNMENLSENFVGFGCKLTEHSSKMKDIRIPR
jgi:hypothetical protein